MGSGAGFPSENISTQDGVNLKEGDSFSAFASEICRQSYKNSPFVQVHDFSKGHFRGPRGFTLRNLPQDVYFDLAPDGIGTKVVLIDAIFAHPLAGQNLAAMCFGDITRWGGLGLILVNVLDVNTLGETGSVINNYYRIMLRGLGAIAEAFGFILYKGETAELGPCVGSENPNALTKFNWSGTAFGVYHQDKFITGDNLKVGQVFIALREYGLRSNGFSSARGALRERFGLGWYENPEAKESIRALAEPAILYDRFLANINGWYDAERIPVELVVHLTGGAIPSKLGEDILFPRGLSAELDDLWEPPKIMRQCKEWRGMNDEDCYETWNGGQGVLLAIDGNRVDDFLRRAQSFQIEAKVCGHVARASEPYIRLRSKFTGKEIVFH